MAEKALKEDLLLFGKKLRAVPIPEIPNLCIYVRNITIGERLAHQQAQGDGGISAQDMLFLCCFDERGRPFFDSSEEAGQLDTRPAGRLLAAILEESGISAAKEEVAEKKSENSPS